MKEKRVLCGLVSLLMVFSLTLPVWSGVVTASPATEIRDWYDLDAIRENLDGNYLLMNSLDATTNGYAELAGPSAHGGKGWQPIGTAEILDPFDPEEPYVPLDPFTGTFYGQGYQIRDLFINRPDEDLVGLFGVVDGGGAIEYAEVLGVEVTGRDGVGGLVGGNAFGGTVTGSYSTGSVSGDMGVGGLVGANIGTINRSYCAATVTGTWGVGGLVGGNAHGGSVRDCYSRSTVTGSTGLGGLVGGNLEAFVINSYSTGGVTGALYVGGLVGYCEDGVVSSSFWDVETSATEASCGGTGKMTQEMQDIATFTAAKWEITAVAFGEHNNAYIWNIVDGETHPWLSYGGAIEPPADQYDLIISSTAGGSVVTPGEGSFTYGENTVVTLVAEADEGYLFVNWAGDVDTLANIFAPTTSITMQDDYSITARFTEVVASRTEEVTDDILDAREEADTTVTVSGTATVTVARYAENPGDVPPTDFSSLGKYVDVYVPDTSQVNEIEIRIYYTDADVAPADVDENSLRPLWWDGSEWKLCSNTGVNTAATNGYSGYAWARITATTEPSLDDLQGTGFNVGYQTPPTPPTGGCFIATAAYGSNTAQEIDILREFRDSVMLSSRLGTELVAIYYKTSPAAAGFISRHECLRTLVRMSLVHPIVRILDRTRDSWAERG